MKLAVVSDLMSQNRARKDESDNKSPGTSRGKIRIIEDWKVESRSI